MTTRLKRCLQFGAGVACLVGASCVSADTLELKNGDLVNGVYMGGTQNTVRFSTESTIETFLVSDLVAITFGGTSTGSAAPVTPAPALEPVQEYTPAYAVVPAGSPLLVRMLDTVDSRQHSIGHRFAATLEGDLVADGKVLAPRGSTVYGALVDANQAGRVKGKTWLVLELREIRIGDRLYPIVTSEYEVRGEKSAGKRTALSTIGGAAVGALIGSANDNVGEGAAIGAGVGFGAAAIGKGEQIIVQSGTLIDYRLMQPFSVK